MTKILVTGATGWLGGQVVEFLLCRARAENSSRLRAIRLS
jgi:nucleoside-diphosphate-sugar epimerase